jgi:hypothetical protein
MAGTVQYASHSNFFTGMVRDVPRHLIPDGAVYDATNIVITNSGSLAKRGASTTALAAATSLAPTEMASQRSANIDGRTRLYPAGVEGGVVKFGSMAFASTTQTLYPFTSSITADAISAPTIYGDSSVFPVASTSGTSPMAFVGGADFSLTSANATTVVSATTATGNNVITLGATAVGTMSVGGYVHLSNGGTDEYTGRIVNTGSTTITVDPPPLYAKTYTSAAYYPVLPQVGTRNDGQYVSSAGCIGTFTSGGDSRIILADVKITNTTTNATAAYPNRLVWSIREAADATVAQVDGLVQATRAGFPALNYIDIEDIEQIIALVPVGSGNMMVLGTKGCVMLSGYLLTQSGGAASASLSRGGITANIRGFSQQVGCLSAKSVQRTSAGVMFAASDGVYLTDGASLVNTMTKKVANLWGDALAGQSLFKFNQSLFDGTDVFAGNNVNLGVYGSANINDSHYYVSLATGGFLCDLRASFGWTRVQSGQLEIAAACVDSDQTTNRIYAVKYGTTSATSSTDRVIRIDRVVVPDNTATDADGSQINCSITTRAYAEGDPAQKRRYRHGLLTYTLYGGAATYPSATTYPSALLYPGSTIGAFTVTATKGLDASGSTTSIGSEQATAQTQTSSVLRCDHQTLSQAVTYTIETTGYPIGFSLYEITNGFNQLRPGRVV